MAVKSIVILLVAALSILGLLVGCDDGITINFNGSGTIGSGDPETSVYDFSGFTCVQAGPAFKVEIVQSDSYSVEVTADDNLIHTLDVTVSGDELRIALEPGGNSYKILEAAITMPALYAVELTAATQCEITGFDSSHDFAAVLSGASRLNGDITTGDAEFDVSSASSVDLGGSAGDIVVEASGASTVDLGGFPVNDADIKLSGASRAIVNLDGRLDADLSSASTLKYIGEPTLGDINISGASTLKN